MQSLSLFIHAVKNRKRIRPGAVVLISLFCGLVFVLFYWVFLMKMLFHTSVLLRNIVSITLIPYSCEVGVM